jgi:hypothetical protein
VVSLVAGEDRHQHFELAPVPGARLEPAMIEICRTAIARKTSILYEGAAAAGRRLVV